MHIIIQIPDRLDITRYGFGDCFVLLLTFFFCIGRPNVDVAIEPADFLDRCETEVRLIQIDDYKRSQNLP